MESIRNIMHLLCNSSGEEEGLEAYEDWPRLVAYEKPETEQLEYILNCSKVPDYVKQELVKWASKQIDGIKEEMKILRVAGALSSKFFSEKVAGTTQRFREMRKTSLRSILLLLVSILVIAVVASILLNTILITNFRNFFVFFLFAVFTGCTTATLKAVRSAAFDRCKDDATDSVATSIGSSVQSRMEWLESYEKDLYELNAVIVKWAAENNSINQTSD